MLTVDKASGRTTLRCESCPASFTRDVEPFDVQSTVTSARNARWSVQRHAGTWQHYCPACAQTRMRGKLL